MVIGSRTVWAVLVGAAALGGTAGEAWAQCPSPAVSVPATGLDYPINRVDVLTTWDPDGDGPLPPLVAASGALEVSRQGTNTVSRLFVGTFDGTSWRQIALDPLVTAMTAYGGELIVTGSFSSIAGITAPGAAMWNGTRWAALPSPGGTIISLHVHNGDLYAGTGSIGTGSARVLRLAGAAWQQVGGAFTTATVQGPPTYKGVNALATHDGQLVAGGTILTNSGVPTPSIARWDGSAWRAMGSLSDDPSRSAVYTLTHHKGELIAGGEFVDLFPAPGMIARWDGAAWRRIQLNPLATVSPNPTVYAVVSDGARLIARGEFTCVGRYDPVSNLAQWDGTEWSALDSARVSTSSSSGPMLLDRGQIYLGGGVALASDPFPGLVCWSRWLDGASVSRRVRAGATVRLSVSPRADLSEQGSLVFSWQRDGATVTDGPGGAGGGAVIAGAASDSLVITRITAADAGAYRVRCQTECDTINSPPMVVTVDPACLADFNGSGDASVQDIFDFLTAWFARCTGAGGGCAASADVDASGEVSVQDLFDFLGAWFAGC